MASSVVSVRAFSAVLAAMSALVLQAVAPAVATTTDTSGVAPNAVGMLDCNGFSPIQRSVKLSMVCTDPRSLYDGKPSRFFDNGHYIGHDEPSIRFLSTVPGSGNNVTWNEQLPLDPSGPPTVSKPGSDVTHWFELSVAPLMRLTVVRLGEGRQWLLWSHHHLLLDGWSGNGAWNLSLL